MKSKAWEKAYNNIREKKRARSESPHFDEFDPLIGRGLITRSDSNHDYQRQEQIGQIGQQIDRPQHQKTTLLDDEYQTPPKYTSLRPIDSPSASPPRRRLVRRTETSTILRSSGPAPAKSQVGPPMDSLTSSNGGGGGGKNISSYLQQIGSSREDSMKSQQCSPRIDFSPHSSDFVQRNLSSHQSDENSISPLVNKSNYSKNNKSFLSRGVNNLKTSSFFNKI